MNNQTNEQKLVKQMVADRLVNVFNVNTVSAGFAVDRWLPDVDVTRDEKDLAKEVFAAWSEDRAAAVRFLFTGAR